MPPAKPKLAQEDWDEAVRTNVEDFDMSPQEAVEAAAEEFEARYDLSAIVRAGAAAAAAHPVAVAAAALRAAMEGQEGDLSAAIASLAEACFPSDEADKQPALAVAAKEGVAALLLGSGNDSGTRPAPCALRLLRRLLLRSADARAAFLQASGVERCTTWLAQSLGVAEAGAETSSTAPPRSWPDAALVVACCEAACLKSEEAKCRFASYVPSSGPLNIARTNPNTTATPCPDEEQANAVGAGGFVSLLLGGVLASAEAPPAAVAAAAGVLRSLTYADDESALASRAFTHARLLAKAHGALRDLLFALQRLSSSASEKEEEKEDDKADGSAPAPNADDDSPLPSTRAEAVAAVLAAVRSVAANDDACRGFSDDGGVRACLELLRRAVEEGDCGGNGNGSGNSGNDKSSSSPTALARSAAGALRQLANSDPVKAQLAGDGALDVIVGAIGRFSGGGGAGGGGATDNKTATTSPAAEEDEDDDDDQHTTSDRATKGAVAPDALEPVAGLLAAMTLRQPELTAAAADAGAVEALCAALKRLVGDEGSSTATTSSAAACRQLCLAVRNMACRGGGGVRSAFLSAGAEPLLRAAKAAHPAACRDVGSAALRDLGLDNYNA